MFFTVPQQAASRQAASRQAASQQSTILTLEPARKTSAPKRKRRIIEEAVDDEEHVQSYYPKRIPRACDRCRLRKTRCSGGKICSKCKHDGVVCVTTTLNPKKETTGTSSEYVNLVESQRDRVVQALQKVLEESSSIDQAHVRAVLTDMGISTNHLQKAPTVNVEPDPAIRDPDENGTQVWDSIFESLNTPQFEAIESLWRSDLLSQIVDDTNDEPTQNSTQPHSESIFDLVQNQSQVGGDDAQYLDKGAEQWLWTPLPYNDIESPHTSIAAMSSRRPD